jgi:hypothetical protein
LPSPGARHITDSGIWYDKLPEVTPIHFKHSRRLSTLPSFHQFI